MNHICDLQIYEQRITFTVLSITAVDDALLAIILTITAVGLDNDDGEPSTTTKQLTLNTESMIAMNEVEIVILSEGMTLEIC